MREHLPFDSWLNAVRWSDDNVRDIILGFRERGLENETLFMMYIPQPHWQRPSATSSSTDFFIFRFLPQNLTSSHGDHGIPFIGNWRTPVNNPHNEPYRVPFLLYNPQIKNPKKKRIEGNYYTLSIPPTVLDIMSFTKSFAGQAQRDLAMRFAANYEYAQSLLRPVNETIRFFTIDPGGDRWILDNGRNLRVPTATYFPLIYPYIPLNSSFIPLLLC